MTSPVSAAVQSRARWAVRHARLVERVYSLFSGIITLFGPALRLLPDRLTAAVLRPVEKFAKQAMFDCSMCGTCILSSTGMSCPMTCPKNLRNGPCGGVRAGGFCEVEPEMRCVWLDAWAGASVMRGGRAIEHVQPPLDRTKTGRSSWAAMIADGPPGRGHATAGSRVSRGDKSSSADAKTAERGAGDPRPASGLARALASGKFCVTAEFNPPDSADATAIMAAAHPLTQLCDAINVTDGAGANTHISSLAVSAILAQAGHQMVMQAACRDRNRIALQADILGAAALGIENVLCLTGDGIKGHDIAGAKPVFDLDCTSLLQTLKAMRDDGAFLSGNRIDAPPSLYLGATSNPCAIDPAIEVARLEKKIAAGAQFIQSQFVYDLDAFERFFDLFRARGLHEKCRYLAGVGPLASVRSARWLRENIAGVVVPDTVLSRLENAGDQRGEGLQICVETIKRLKQTDGVAGVHIMAFQRPDLVERLVNEAEL